jgi:type IV secretion system protein VirD4
MGDDIAKAVAMLFLRLIKPVAVVLIWTYLWIPFLGVGIASSIGGPPWLVALMVLLSLFLWVWLFLQRIVRLFKKDPGFSFLALIVGKAGSRKEKKDLDPKADKGLLAATPEAGYPVGQKGRRWVVLPDSLEYHALIVGGSGSGKTSTQVIPLLLKSRLPAFCVDVKGELYEKTFSILSKRVKIKVFNPSDPSAWGYDPFGAVRPESCVLDMTTIANALVPLSPGAGKDEFWISEAQNYLAGALLFSWEKGATFTQAMRTIQSTPADKLVAAAVKNGSEDVRVLLGHFDGMASETLSSVFATLSSKTMIFASDPDIMRCFNSDRVIRPEDLLDGSTTIFLQIPEHRLEVYRNVTQLIIGQFLKFWEQQPDGSAPRVNFILDEFFRLGKLSSVENGLATLRSKGVRIHAITQSLAQIEQLYERVGARALADNFTVKVLLGATEPESQKYFADLIGSYDKAMRSTSSSQQLANFGGSAGVSWSEQERKIIRPEQLARLGNECILFAPGGWSRVQKRPYYATKELQN